MQINGKEYEVGIDAGTGRDVSIEEHYRRPDAEYPDGSWMHKVGGEVTIATGYYAKLYPGKPSPYWHEGPPFVVIDTSDWEYPWKESKK